MYTYTRFLSLLLVGVLMACEARWKPAAEAWVDETSSWLTDSDRVDKLETDASQVMRRFDGKRRDLPEAAFSVDGRAVPTSVIPPEFRSLGGIYKDPQVFLRFTDERASALVVSYGHLRRAIIVYRVPPSRPPSGDWKARVSQRVFVVADKQGRVY